jgi:oxygen-independent coproporphyrinogen-3 oxidase
MSMPLLPNDPPTAAYIHVPFCRHRCGYCNFTLVAGRDDLIDSYLQAVERELQLVKPRAIGEGLRYDDEGSPSPMARGFTLDTLYFGGGTPTHLPPHALAKLFALVRQQFTLNSNAEFTVEANPLDLDAERCAVLRDSGVTRLSLGVQSFRDAKLAILERDHRQDDIARDLELARSVANSVSLDLIYATPGESLAQWLDDVDRGIATGADHISIYGLTIEQGAAFYGRHLRGTLAKTPESLEAEMYEAAIDRLAAAGFVQYEVSNFARPGSESRHNQTYWRGRSYYAFGPGAARYVGGRRETNHRSTTTYIQRVLSGQSPVAEAEELSPEDRARERLVFGLRMLAGVTNAELLADTGYDIESLIGRELPWMLEQGLLAWSGEQLHLTHRGLLVSDSLWPRFLRT